MKKDALVCGINTESNQKISKAFVRHAAKKKRNKNKV